jgi:hypothetical protein
MTTNEPNYFQLIEDIVRLVDNFATRTGDTRSAYDWVLELAEPAVGVEHTDDERELLDKITNMAEATLHDPMWPAHWDPILDAMDEIGDAAND